MCDCPIDLSDVKDYENENCFVEYASDLLGEEANKLIGKTVAKIKAYEHSLMLTFTDGSKLTLSGYTCGDCPMGAEYEDA